MQWVLALPSRYKSYGTASLLVGMVGGVYAIELVRSIHGLVFMHDLLNTSMGIMLLTVGAVSLLCHPRAATMTHWVLHSVEIALGILFLFNFSTVNQSMSDGLNTALICLSAFTLLYSAHTRFQRNMAITMIGIGFIMIGFYTHLHTSVISLTHFRMMR